MGEEAIRWDVYLVKETTGQTLFSRRYKELRFAEKCVTKLEGQYAIYGFSVTLQQKHKDESIKFRNNHKRG